MEILQLNLLLKSDFLSPCYADRTAGRVHRTKFKFPTSELIVFYHETLIFQTCTEFEHYAHCGDDAGLFEANFVCTFSSFFNDLPHCLLETVCTQHYFLGFQAFLGGGFGNIIHELVLASTQGLFTGGLHGILLGDCRADPWGHPTGLRVCVQGL